MNAVKLNTISHYQNLLYFPKKTEINFKSSEIKDEFSYSQNSILQQNCKIGDITIIVLKLVGLKYPLLKNHLIGTSLYAKAFAQEMGLSKKQIDETETAALLHDVSKIGHSDKFFQGEASSLDREKNKLHQKISSDIAKTIIPFKDKIAGLIEHHHDEFKTNGKNIPIEDRIISVCDAFDSMTTKKYRTSIPKTPQKAVIELKKNEKGQWDPEIVEKFCNFISKNDFQFFKNVTKYTQSV